MFTNLMAVVTVLVLISCSDSLPGAIPDVYGSRSTIVDVTTDSGTQTDSGTPTAGLDIKVEIEPDSDNEVEVQVQPDTWSGEDVATDDTEEVVIDVEVSIPDTADTMNACVKMADLEQAEACWNGVDDDCDGLTDQEGGDPDCTGYCHPASGVCTDNDPTTEDFCSPDDWTCKNLGCATDCNDDNVCTTDSCINGQCQSLEIEKCFPCSDASDCAFGVNPKIPDYGFYCDFTAGVCAHLKDECATDADCEDGDPCTPNACSPAYHAGGILVCGVKPPYNTCKDPCVSNIDCYSKQMTCQLGVCKPATFSEVVGDGHVCEFQSDCDFSPWGKVCVWENLTSSLALCHECSQEDEDGDGIDRGCTEGRPHCYWGASWPNPATGKAVDIYYCDK